MSDSMCKQWVNDVWLRIDAKLAHGKGESSVKKKKIHELSSESVRFLFDGVKDSMNVTWSRHNYIQYVDLVLTLSRYSILDSENRPGYLMRGRVLGEIISRCKMWREHNQGHLDDVNVNLCYCALKVLELLQSAKCTDISVIEVCKLFPHNTSKKSKMGYYISSVIREDDCYQYYLSPTKDGNVHEFSGHLNDRSVSWLTSSCYIKLFGDNSSICSGAMPQIHYNVRVGVGGVEAHPTFEPDS